MFKISGKSKLAIAFPSTITNSTTQEKKKVSWLKTHGYRLFFFDASSNSYAAAPAILPVSKTINSFLMHLTAVDGGGRILLYWYNVNAKTMTAAIRGRLIFGDNLYSEDFDLASFNMGTSAYWYGDYMTAEGFATGGKPLKLPGYDFFPMWTQPNQTLDFVRVTVFPAMRAKLSERIKIQQPIPKWRAGPPAIDASRLREGVGVRWREGEIETEQLR